MRRFVRRATETSLLAFLAAGSASPLGASAQDTKPTLAELRSKVGPNVLGRETTDDPPVPPPAGVFDLVHYPSAVGPLAAYVTPDPKDGRRHPAILWIQGGDTNAIGESWEPRPADNDQSAAALRVPGLVLMLPSLRGGNDNPGEREGAYGEVDDVLAAASWLATQPWVDPSRIYLGGHSTGGTLALLVAESSDRFRAVFALGPVHVVSPAYLSEFMGVRVEDLYALAARSPGMFLRDLRTPTWVIEGEGGNSWFAEKLRAAAATPLLHVHVLAGHDHFDVVRPVSELIADEIRADVGPKTAIEITDAELRARFPATR